MIKEKNMETIINQTHNQTFNLDKTTWANNKESKADDMIYFLYEDLMVYFDSNNLSPF